MPLLQREIAVVSSPNVVAVKIAALGAAAGNGFFCHNNHLTDRILYSDY